MTGIIVVNKPPGWTSQDVVAKLRGILRERRIGHGGTLDPMATGVLPVFVGRATRAVQFFENADKEYVAGLKLGMTTDTQDITGAVLSEQSVGIPPERLEQALCAFRGEIMQIPPMYSAVKVGGQRLYSIARKGGTAERTARKITVSAAEIVEGCRNEYKIRFAVSKGTYIRALCSDIGDALGVGGVMSSLVRTRAGQYTLEQSVTLDEIAAAVAEGRDVLLPLDTMFAAFPALRVTERDEQFIRNGRGVKVQDVPDGKYRLYNDHDDFLAICQIQKGEAAVIKSFYEV